MKVSSFKFSIYPLLVFCTLNAAIYAQNAFDTEKAPLFEMTLQNTVRELEKEMDNAIQVPVPKDLAGGYTHERHKRNYIVAQKAGELYKILGDEKYARYIKEMLLEYADIYPELPLHPAERSYARGKIFWQSLNDANWLVAMSQAYGNIYDYLSKEDREILEQNLFLPFADFLSVGNPKFFNRIHNHSTWGNAAVGMIGLVMNNDELVNRALYGLEKPNISENARDDDGGLIIQKGQQAGFLANIVEAFSPSGYYTEGPYYQRYAMYPFIMFAKELEDKRPGLKIFNFKDQVLIKAVYALIHLTDSDGDFFPLNDAQKGMSLMNTSVVIGVDAAYYYGDQDPGLLSIAKRQGRVTLDEAGMAVALAIEQGKTEDFERHSIDLTDGPEGNKGGISVLRSEGIAGNNTLVFKYTSQGDSHGHYDKLSFSFYIEGEEIIQDYGFARFVNIEPKNGGGYLKENTTWAKQSIAHNTIVQNEKSHFDGDFDIGSRYHSNKYFSDYENENFQIVSAIEENAYKDSKLHRTMALMKSEIFTKPVILDIYSVRSKTPNQYDLPYYYFGQIIDVNFKYDTPEKLPKLGTRNGYQHLWTEAVGSAADGNTRFTWSNSNKFYTLTQALDKNDSIILARIGASDPQFNLRRDPVLISRKENVKDALFVSILEPHGNYNPVTELGNNSYSELESLEIFLHNESYTGIEIIGINGKEAIFLMSNKNNDSAAEHKIEYNGKEFLWKGPYNLITK